MVPYVAGEIGAFSNEGSNKESQMVMPQWSLAAGAVASTMRFLACMSVVHEPEFWTVDRDLPNHYLPRLLERDRLFTEVEELLTVGRDWTSTTHRDGITVKSGWVPRYGRTLFWAEATMPASPDQMLDVFWADGEKIVNWNPTARAVEVVKDFDAATRITWQATKPQVGGLIASRDFVNLNFWRKVHFRLAGSSELSDKYSIQIAYTNTTWPSKPPNSDYVRGSNGPSIMVFTPIPGLQPEETYTRMTWIFNADMDFSVFIPAGVVSRVIPSNLIEYLQNLRNHVKQKHAL